ncbi:MAG: hypothetical protein WD064_03595 [Acidimicrobiia bacterium]
MMRDKWLMVLPVAVVLLAPLGAIFILLAGVGISFGSVESAAVLSSAEVVRYHPPRLMVGIGSALLCLVAAVWLIVRTDWSSGDASDQVG